jgi:hypothetical protein
VPEGLAPSEQEDRRIGNATAPEKHCLPPAAPWGFGSKAARSEVEALR